MRLLRASRLLLQRTQLEVQQLVRWSIQNPGTMNTTIRRITSHMFPVPSGAKLRQAMQLRVLGLLRMLLTAFQSLQPVFTPQKTLDIDVFLNDMAKCDRYFARIQSSSALSVAQTDTVSRRFVQALFMASERGNSAAYDFALETWKRVFDPKRSDLVRIQDQIWAHRDHLVHLSINYMDFELYEGIIAPVWPHMARSWADTLAYTLRFQVDQKDRFSYGKMHVERFLDSNESERTKSRLLAVFLRKGLLYAETDDRYAIIREFLQLRMRSGDHQLLFEGEDRTIFEKSLRLLASPFQGWSLLSHIHQLHRGIESSSSEAPKEAYWNLLSACMAAVLPFSPSTALGYWTAKKNLIGAENGTTNPALRPEDLKIAMKANLNMRKYDQVLKIYGQHPELHLEMHIDVLLKVSEQSRDWKLLQLQFEEMYGRDELPYVVHYATVMNALASIGAEEDVEKLFRQLQKRQLKPTPSIYGALIKTRVVHNDMEGAKRWFDAFLDVFGPENPASEDLHGLLFELYFKKADLASAMSLLRSSLAEQEEKGHKSIGGAIMARMLDLASSSYDLVTFEELQELAFSLNLANESFYCSLIKGYTSFDEHERANSAAFNAHMDSDVPFTSAPIYCAQLRNYRSWLKATTHYETRKHLEDRIFDIVDKNEAETISPRARGPLFEELIRYNLSLGRLKEAQDVFQLAKIEEALVEAHFLPFFDYHSKLGATDSSSLILDVYRDMARENVKITTKTYVYLINTLLQLDSRQENNYQNSYNLLESVFDLNGLSISKDKAPASKKIDVSQNAVDLCKIVSAYVMATSSSLAPNMDLLVHFLDQIRTSLDSKLTSAFRFTIYSEMSKLYYKQGRVELASKLVESGLAELHTITDRFVKSYPYKGDFQKIKIPRKLQKEYRKLASLNILCMQASGAPPLAYGVVFDDADAHNVELAGEKYNALIRNMLRDNNSQSLVSKALEICEKHLMAGTWVQTQRLNKLQHLFKLTVLVLYDQIGPALVHQRYGMLCDFYDVRNVRKEMGDINHYKALEHELAVYALRFHRGNPITVREILQNIPSFFSPEKRIPTRNKILDDVARILFCAVEQFCVGDKIKAFALMDDYPETMEFLLYHGHSHIRYSIFRQKVDEMVPALISGQAEVFESRQARTIQALRQSAAVSETTGTVREMEK